METGLMAFKMDVRTGEDFFDINFPFGLNDYDHVRQGDFSIAHFDLQHQDDLFLNVPNALDTQTFENRFLCDQPFNTDHAQEQVDLSLPRPSNPSIPRRRRLTKVQKSCLSGWLLAHQSDPYPTTEEISALAAKAVLTEKQVRTWFNNARSRQSFQGKPLAPAYTMPPPFDQ
jgi:Homeobox KN domain